MTQIERDHGNTIKQILEKMGSPFVNNFKADRLSGDGSDRGFYRVVWQPGKTLLFVFPSPSNPKSMLETESCYRIGRHLKDKKVPVPQIYHFAKPSGVIVYEDLGDTLLYDIALHEAKRDAQGSITRLTHRLSNLYRNAVDCLIALQIQGANGFEGSFCWETPQYSKTIMLERESGYFLDAYCRQYRKIRTLPNGLKREFIILADRVAQEPCNYLMHRDFQSRNIMVKEDNIHIIDFQGARFGPLAYDLASLLNDPYVQLARDVRLLLLDHYIDRIREYISLDRDDFIRGYYHIAVQRNLQILGAFSFLATARGKDFFKPYIQPALLDLKSQLYYGPLLNQYPVLADFTEALLHN
jgi:aminoglycoside/choline kinase family phosphotransferase